MLVLIKSLHTIVWALFVACILGIYVAANAGRFDVALGLAGVVLVECLVLLINRMRCPLTSIAGRFTTDRRPNFDIYLPEWLARSNQRIFGALYLGGLAYALCLWLLSSRPGP